MDAHAEHKDDPDGVRLAHEDRARARQRAGPPAAAQAEVVAEEEEEHGRDVGVVEVSIEEVEGEEGERERLERGRAGGRGRGDVELPQNTRQQGAGPGQEDDAEGAELSEAAGLEAQRGERPAGHRRRDVDAGESSDFRVPHLPFPGAVVPRLRHVEHLRGAGGGPAAAGQEGARARRQAPLAAA